MNGLEVHDGRRSAKIEQIVADAAVAGASALLATNVRESVLHRDALTEAFAPTGRRDEFSQAMLQAFVLGNGYGSAGALIPNRARERPRRRRRAIPAVPRTACPLR
jgi:hypothetical protein